MTKFLLSPVKNKSTASMSKKLARNGFFSKIIYMRNSGLENEMMRKLKDGDVLELHADSNPWTLGGETINEKTDFSPFSLAEHFRVLFAGRNVDLTIDLRCCNSATIADGAYGEICFARDLSRALYELGMDRVKVYGYSAYVHSENPFKQSAVEDGFKHGAKVRHCSLDEARVVYENGVLISDAVKRLVAEYPYNETDIEKDQSLQSYMSDKKKHDFLISTKEAELSLVEIDVLSLDEENHNPNPAILFSSIQPLTATMMHNEKDESDEKSDLDALPEANTPDRSTNLQFV